jgi:signal transduction histidine kinase
VERLAQAIEKQAGLPDTMANKLRALTHNPNESLGGEFEVSEPQRRVLVWYSLPVYAQSGTRMGRIFAFRDATREREVDRMKTEFITLVSHELRTPLTSVKGFSDLILEDGTDQLDADTREYLSIIALNADRLITLINDILDVTRIETDRVELKPDLCPMQEVIGQVAVSLQPQLDEHGHHLALDLEPHLPPVWADHGRMVQILSNLVSNAIKYTLEPGEIAVRARYVQQTEALPPAASKDQILPCVMVSVQDTGLGIAPEDQPNLFKRFFRANTEATRLIGGTGLGLTIVKSFVEMHGGQIWFESAPGKGSTFHFTVPVVERQSLAN